jgi:hypothetical protein
MKNYEFLEKDAYFSKKTDKGNTIVYDFLENRSSEVFRCWITIPKTYDPTSHITWEVYGSDYFYRVEASPWFLSLIEKARQVYKDINKLRRVFYQQKDVETILKETLLVDELQSAAETWAIFEHEGIIVTNDSGVYDDLKEALICEGYELDTSFNREYYRIDIIKK